MDGEACILELGWRVSIPKVAEIPNNFEEGNGRAIISCPSEKLSL